MEKMIEAHCQQLLHDIVSLTILDLVACFIVFIIMRWIENVIENRFLFLPALLLQFLLSYLLDKLCQKYITLILSYIYISMCKSILSKSILKIDFSLVTRNRGKVFFSMCKSILPKSILKIGFSLVTRNREKVLFGISTCFVISASFLLGRSVRNYFQDSILFLFTSIVLNFTSILFSNANKLMEMVVNLFSPLTGLNQRSVPTMEKLFNLLLSPLYYQDSILLLFSSIVLNYTLMPPDNFFPKYLAYISFFISLDFPSRRHLHEEELITNDTETKIETTHKQDIGIKRGEVGFVFSNIGMSPLSQEGDEIRYFTSHEEFSTLFDQTEPGLHEVEEAFSIFDQNRDGFIDAKELQTVLINLGLREGTDVRACQSMIDKYDRNRKGKIDQTDFFKLVESALL